MEYNPLIVKCSSCGSPAEYNIKEQSYCCPACGNKTSVTDPVNGLAKWREQHQEKIKSELRELPHSLTRCPNCGAEFFFKENEFTDKCPYCETPMVRKEFEESDSFPELIIPFTITLEEAKESLLKWINENASRKEAKLAKENINKLKGYYLPYCLIKGPIKYNITRQSTNRKFNCEAFVEQNVVNASKDLDNEVLDAMEPYDWSKVVPFDFGYIAGQSVKIRDIQEGELINRAIDEVTSNIKPEINEELDSQLIEIKTENATLMTSPILLPVYYFTVGKFNVAVNGQTGRVSMTKMCPTTRFVNYSGWVALPVLLAIHYAWIVFAEIHASSFDEIIEYLFPSLLCFFFFDPFGYIFWALPKNIKRIVEQKPLASQKCIAIRRNDLKIQYEYGDSVLSDAWPKPFFYVNEDKGVKKVEFNVDKYRNITLMAIGVMAAPGIVCFLYMIPALFFIQDLSIFKTLFSEAAIDTYFLWAIFVYSCFHFVGANYNKKKYDYEYIDSGNEYVLNARFMSCFFYATLVFTFAFGFLLTIMFLNESHFLYKKEDVEKARSNLQSLKQSEVVVNNIISKRKAEFRMNNEKHSYEIHFFNNKMPDDVLYSETYEQDEREYYSRKGDKISKKLYVVKVKNKEIEFEDKKESKLWTIVCVENAILIQKGWADKKTLYAIKLDASKSNYVVTDADNKYVCNSYYYKENAAVFKEDENKKRKLVYLLSGTKPNSNGKNLLAAPAILQIEEIEEKLCFIMMLEFSQIE